MGLFFIVALCYFKVCLLLLWSCLICRCEIGSLRSLLVAFELAYVGIWQGG